MSGENVTSMADATAKEKGDSSGRQRSSIAFPYDDLDSAVALALAIHNNVGTGECSDDQLAAWTNQSSKSSGYRTQVTAARMFGVIETSAQGHRLTDLGRKVVDPARAREGKVEAFLRVPLYRAVFEKYRGGVLPPTAALERSMMELGVADNTKERARRIMERAAQQSGFFDLGRDRLVMPGIQPAGPPPKEDLQEKPAGSSGGGGGGHGKQVLHPLIEGLIQTLPPSTDRTEWPLQARAKWLQAAANIFDLIYEGDGGIEVRPALADRSPLVR